MRGHDDVVAGEERVLDDRLLGEHVERRAGDPAGVEAALERVEVDQLATGAVDDPDAVLHLRDRIVVDPVDGLRRLRQVERDQVGALIQLLGRLDPRHPELAEALRRDELVEGEDRHFEAEGAAGDELADSPEAEDPERLAVELVAPVSGARPLPFDQRRMSLGDVAKAGQRQRHRVLGRSHGVRLGRVRDDDPPLRGGLDVDVVDAGAGSADRAQPVRPPDQLGGQLRRRANDDRLELADSLPELALGPVGADLDVELLAQQIDAGFGDLLLDQHPHRRTASAFSRIQSIDPVSASTSAGSTEGNIPIRSWLRPSFR